MKKSTLLFSALLAFQVLPVVSQPAFAQSDSPAALDPTAMYASQFDAARLRQEYASANSRKNFPGARQGPYTYEMLTDTTVSLVAGTHVKTQQKETRALDKQGRTRIDYTFPNLQRTIIVDPLAKAVYLVCPESQEVLRLTGAALDAPASAAPVKPSLDDKHTTSTSLGEKDVGGVKAFGSRSEIVTPAGTQGNDKDIVSVTELWFSLELGTPVYLRTASPLFGETFTRIENLKFADVPASTFVLPAGYTVRDIALAQQ